MKALFVGIVIAAGVIVLLLLNQYFQQDEWHSFGLIQSYGWRYITLDKPLLQLLFNDRVGARIVIFSLFSTFGISGFWFGVFSMLIHSINTFFVFLLVKKFFGKTSIALLSSLFFFVNTVGHQAYSWFGTLAGSAPSVTFILVSVLFYLGFLKKRKIKHVFISVFFIWVSLLFKESGYFLFLLYPLLWILFTKKKTVGGFLKENVLIIFYGVIMTILLAISIIAIPGERANYVSPTSSGITKLLTHIFLYPVEGIVQVFLPSGVIFPFANLLTQLFVPSLTPQTPEFDLFYTTKMVEGVSLGLFAFIALCFVLLNKHLLISESREIKSSFIFSLLFLSLSFLPYIVLDKFDGYLDSRYYYPATAGAAVLFSALFFLGVGRTISTAVRRIFAGVAVFFIIIHFSFLTFDLFHLMQTGNERKRILQQITGYVPKLRPKTVFFVTGNSSGYYAIPQLQVPFQSGLGQVLMVVYAEKGQVDQDLFKEKTLLKTLDMGFLYDTLAQGYKETQNQGFGYFYQEASLRRSLESGQFEKSDVVSLYYDSDTKTIRRASNFQ